MSEKIKAMTATELRQRIAEVVGITAQQSKAVLETLASITIEQTNTVGNFTIPGICKVTKLNKPAKPERKMISPLTKQEITVKAKPAYSIVKVKPVKALKESVA